jgi:hypothetical protein
MICNSFIWVYDGKSCLWWFDLNKSVALTSLAWGLFFVLIGLSWALYGNYGEVVVFSVALGAGIILIGLNVARTGLGMTLSKFSLFIGIVAFAFGGAALMGYSLPLPETIVVLIGLFIIAEAVRSLTKSH